MSWRNTRTAYGWAAIALHWIAAAAVVTLYLLGERMEEAADRAQELAARQVHVSVGVLLFAFLVAQIFWNLSQARPEPLEKQRALRLVAGLVQILFLVMIALLLISGPAVIWSAARPIRVFDWFAIPSPFSSRVDWLHEAAEFVHEAAAKLFWPLIVLHVLGGLKHLVIDRDRTVQRMLWVRRAP
ncbi:cytochrome b561 [Caulobacter ginsengisoli]|uniref:Cytochrome b561 n=1 Tax=Caulobacter ginsengisoli TaxID=400775 RepID=A0ABU0IPT1_9CAUL|nr:cytochrome b [Caulobacter ginsengisoli]MDQ0464007.1 cytochrome b561 [Caulobacter ginsengisoli]